MVICTGGPAVSTSCGRPPAGVYRQTDGRQTDRPAERERETDKRANEQTDRHADMQACRHAGMPTASTTDMDDLQACTRRSIL